ncbi:MAG: AMP-dependent synthetase/ligase, partial [Phycisphaerae bacterium]
MAGGPDWARDLLAEARSHCDATVDLTLLCEAADALGRALESANDADRDALRAICHDFIDLARRRTVRLAGFGNDAGRQWIQRVVGLIERSDLTVGHMLRQRRTQYADKPLFLVPQGERCTTYTFQQVVDVTDQLAKGIYSLLGERPRVAMCSANRVEGALLDLACLANGIFVTPIPPHTVSAQLGPILKESAAQMLFVSGPGQVQNAIDVLGELPDLRWLVVLGDGPPSVGGAANTLSYAQLLEKGASAGAEGLMSGRRGVRSSDLATTMYTSGTTGAPKGIQFTQLNLVSKRFCRAAALPEMDHQEVFLCYLPLYHTFGRFLEMLGCVHLGATYVFAENPSTDTLLAQMKRFQPTALISVPKKWRDIHQCVGAQVPDEDDPQRVRAVLEETTGGKLRWGLSAAGRLDPDVFRFFQRHGLDLMSGYGMTEATGGITMTPPGGYVPDSIGPPLPGIDIKLGPDGELMLRGPYVSPGYTDARDNLAAFSDGWLHTGDIVRCDRQGYYWHVDRKKDIYKNSGGRTVAPQRVERLFADFPEISRVFAVGDGREFVTLLIRPNTDYAEVNLANMSEATMREYFRGLVASCNRFLAPFERVIDFALIDRDFSEQHGELTSKSSFRRSVVEQHFAPQIERMYASTTLERSVDGLRVPVAFLQHLGATESGVKVTSEGLLFQAIERTLPMRRDRRARHLVWVGNCCYALPAETVDLNQWLRLPELWVGNAELTDVSGESILLWSVSEGRRGGVNMIEAAPAGVDTSQWRERCGQRRAAREVDLLTVHAACSVLLEPSPAVALSAVDYLAHVLAEGQERLASLAEARLQLAADHPDEAVRSRAFAALYEYQTQGRFGVTASRFCRTWRPVLDDQACQVIARLGPRCESWEDFARVLENLRPAPGRQVEPQVGKFVLGVLVKLVRVADLTRDFYLPVRRELIAWMTACGPGELRDGAQRLLNELIRSFRDWLGQSKRSAVDPATGRQYTWGETLHFEEGIDPVELGRIANAIQHTELVREAVYL